MPIHLTTQGQRAIDYLEWLGFALIAAHGDNEHLDQRLTDQHEQRKAKSIADLKEMVLPHLAPGQRWEDVVQYNAESAANKNRDYTEQLERMLGELGVCRAVDIYHCYLRRILQHALSRDASQIRKWAVALEIKPNKLAKIEATINRPDTILRLFRGREGIWRKLVHEFLNVWQDRDVGIFVEARNCLVHDMGEDREGRVASAVTGDSKWRPRIEDGMVRVTAKDGIYASHAMLSDISIMDQQFANIFTLPTQRYDVSQKRRVYG